MDARDLDLSLLAAALEADDRRAFIALLARAKIEGHVVDVQVAGSEKGYTTFATVTNGDEVVEDAMFVVPRPEDELRKLALLRLRVETILDGHARWSARHGRPPRAEAR